MKKILLIYAHPSPHKSRYNRSLIATAQTLPFIEVRDLYEIYPTMHIDEQTEQTLLRAADVVVFQFPVYWFSAPSILKEWQDSVLQHGFAYGEGGDVLRGKTFMIAASTGGPESAYRLGESHGADIDAYLWPIEMTARFCGMHVAPAFVSHCARHLDYDNIKSRAQAYSKVLAGLVGEECR